MRSILPFDELNAFRVKLLERYPDGKLVIKDDFEDILDWMLDIFLLAFAQGKEYAEQSLFAEVYWEPSTKVVMETINKEVAGKTWIERVEEYFASGGSVDDLVRIAETEAHRDGNEAALMTAKGLGAKKKTWVTMLDDRVRDTHAFLEAVSVGIDDEFYSFDGDHAPAPGLFENPENNVNCRCQLSFS